MPRDRQLPDVVLITGAASGIGAALAERLVGQSSGVLLTTRRNIDDLETVARRLRSAGLQVETASGDLAERGQTEAFVECARSAFGRLDAIVSNAGAVDRTSLLELAPEHVEHAYRSMAGSFVELVQAAMPLLRQSPIARVVAVSSFIAHRFRSSGNIFPATAAAKAALEVFVKNLAHDLASDGVLVNAVVPGHIEKTAKAHLAAREDRERQMRDLIPMRRLGQPDEVAAMIEFLLSNDASYITGQLYHVDGGLTL